MLNTNASSDRLYGLMQMLLAEAATGQALPLAEARGVVTQQDALDAVLNLAGFLDANLQAGRISHSDGGHMAAMLMVVRDFIKPLPTGLMDLDGKEVDGVTVDLQTFVDGLRVVGADTGVQG